MNIKMKKVIQILLICLMIAGIVVIATLGFNVGLKYSENTQINIAIEKEFNIEDIQKIADEVFGNNKAIVQVVELYEDMIQITVKEASQEQIENLNTKINEKYELENEVSDFLITNNANTKLRDLVKPYILPIVISVIIILVYEMIRFNKLGIWRVLYKSGMIIIAPQAILFSVYAITRLPINRLTAIISLALYIASIFCGIAILLKENDEKKSNSDENKK